MTGRIPKLAAALLATSAAIAVTAGTATATPVVVYNNIPSPLPGSLQSQSFEASATSEYGGQVAFEAGSWKNPTVTVTMDTWACFEGSWYEGNCKTPPGAKFEWPVTISIYEVGAGNTVGAKIASGSKTFKMPYRPSANTSKCTGANAGKWWFGKEEKCYNGKRFKISLGLKAAKLPANAIVSVSYNTTDWGLAPTHVPGPYDSLNVAETNAPATVGEAPLPEEAYITSAYESEYCGSGAFPGFGLTPCTEGAQPRDKYQPAIEVRASAG